MAMDQTLKDHQSWIGYLQPEGLVVSAAALVDSQASLDLGQAAGRQIEFQQFVEWIPNPIVADQEREPQVYAIGSLQRLMLEFLNWPSERIQGLEPSNPVPEELKIPLRDFGETLEPTYAFLRHVTNDDEPSTTEASQETVKPWMLLVQELPVGTRLDIPVESKLSGWSASPTRRFERLLRETEVPIGLLTNSTHIQLIYAPRGENSGTMTFPVAAMTEISGRPILAAFHMLLSRYRLLAAPTKDRLPGLLQRSRDYQVRVSNALAKQVLEALYELLRGFQSADDMAAKKLLEEVLKENPDQIYNGLLSVLMRLVFLLYAEDQGLMPDSDVYTGHYSVHGLFQRLRNDAEQFPDTMEHRYGAWAQLLALFRLVYQGSRHKLLQMPAREGHLFDPSRYPFLEGRSGDTQYDPAKPLRLPLVPDGTVYRVLEKLLVLEGERLSYRTLDVEQIGSVYETMIGFHLQRAAGVSIALKPGKSHGAPVPVNLEELLQIAGDKRKAAIKEQTDYELTTKMAAAVKSAESIDDLLIALESRIARGATPQPVSAGTMLLVPSDERRRSGSHYTPRSLTEPIVRTTLEPILRQLGEQAGGGAPSTNPDASVPTPTPNAILDLKICDPAMGSGAFLVEACRQLAEALVDSWTAHGYKPYIPPDEDELLHARRLVAQRCLYGVDKNPMAVDLAKLSLWLATLAKDHPFTFVDHSLRCGDSLVGLNRKQLASFHWDSSKRESLNRLGLKDKEGTEIETRIKRASDHRKTILDAGDNMLPGMKLHKLREADNALEIIRVIGNACLRAFFSSEKPKERNLESDRLFQSLSRYIEDKTDFAAREQIASAAQLLKDADPRLEPFHWEIEYPEVFGRKNPGFDCLIGNPPFVDSETMSREDQSLRGYLAYAFDEASGNWDLYVPFIAQSLILTRSGGRVALLSPNKWFGAPYGEKLRESTIEQFDGVFDYSGGRAFEDVGVAVICSFFEKPSRAPEITVSDCNEKSSPQRPYPISREFIKNHGSWGLLLSDHLLVIQDILGERLTLGAFIDAHDPFTVGEAYELKSCMYDGDPKPNDFRFINTGSIDPFIVKWGQSPTRYLKDSFVRPCIDRECFESMFPVRYRQARQPKIAVSGMRNFEAFLDLKGEFVVGKSSIVIRAMEDSICLTALTGILNSKLVRFYLQECYGVLGVDGGISFSGKMIKTIPVPEGFDGRLPTVASLVEEIARNSTSGEISNDLLFALDDAVFDAYTVTPPNREIIRNYDFKC